MNENVCPICGMRMAYNGGVKGGSIAMIDSEIKKEDYNRGQLYARRTSYNGSNYSPQGQVIFQEVARAGLPVQDILYTALWMHPRTDTKKVNSPCIEHMIGRVMEETKDCKYILLMGAEATSVLAEQPMIHTMGLEVHASLFGRRLVMVAPSPAQVVETTVGEFRNALTRFNAVIRKLSHD